jgi:Mg/Co/Ni transporter MgtE
VLSEVEEEQSEQILDEMEPEDKEEVEELLDIRDDTAAALMDTETFALPETATVAEAMAELAKSDQAPEEIYSIFLTDKGNHLVATVPLAKLFFAAGDTPLKDLAADPLLVVQSDEKQDRVAELFDKYNLLALPVLDENEELIGVIKVDDVVTLLRQR